MRITELSLKRFNPFVFNNVELFELNVTNDVLNVIGSNGAGKSSLLRELNPRPATRTDFGAGGYKHIRLIYENVEYVLKSDFSAADKPHSFEKEGEELNPSGTTQMQEELVRKVFGYTPQVHAICYGEQGLSSIRVGLRENYLLTIHPCQMKLLLDKHTNVEKKLRGIRSNLSMLYERQTALGAQMIDADLRRSLQEENDKLNHEIVVLVGALHKLNNQRQNIVTTLSEYPSSYVTRSVQDCKRTRKEYVRFGDISRDQSLADIKTLTMSDLSRCKTQRDADIKQIQMVTSEINKYEQHLRQSDAQSAIILLETTIQSLKTDISALEADTLEQPFDPYCLEDIPRHIDRVTNMIAVFIDYGSDIPALKDVSLLETKFRDNQKELGLTERRALELQDRLFKIEKNLHTQLLESIPTGCHECVLFRQYSETADRLKSEYNSVSEELRLVTRKGSFLTRLVDGRQERLHRYTKIVPQLQRMSAYLNEHRFLMLPFKGLDLLTTLRQNPSALLVRLQIHYERSRNHHLRIKKQEDLARRIADYERLKRPSEFGKQFLETMVAEKHLELSRLRETYGGLCAELEEKENFLLRLSVYVSELNTLSRDCRVLEQQEQFELLTFDREVCDKYITSLTTVKTRTVSRLSEIDRVLREQDTLLARRQEVSESITTLEFQLQELLQVETALSPTTGIPYRYMVQFINDLCAHANTFISEVFGYPFEFLLFSPGESLDYKFRMRVGDVIIPDISRGSDAQKAMGDLAFRLAQVIELKQSKYGLYLDECDKTFDSYHKQKLLDLLKSLIDDEVVSQLFMVNHNVATYSGMQNADTVVLNETNIVLPSDYNQHVRMVPY